VPSISGHVSVDLVNFKIAKIFIIILSTVPYTLMAINLFSAKNIIDRARSRYTGQKNIPEFYLHLCLALRMFQHVGEVVTRLFDVWTEEHPQLLIPRNRRQWGVNWYSPVHFFPWAVEAISSWIFACLMVTFAPLPAFVRELKVMQRAPDTGATNEVG